MPPILANSAAASQIGTGTCPKQIRLCRHESISCRRSPSFCLKLSFASIDSPIAPICNEDYRKHLAEVTHSCRRHTFHGWIARLVGLFNKQRNDRELDDEIESHVQMHVEDNRRSGM